MQDINLCSIDGCGRQAKSLGWCVRHYTRNRRYGSPTGEPRRATLRERIEAKIIKSEGCWLWAGAHNVHGYSTLRISRKGDSRNVLVHREVCSWTNDIEGREVDHICHNRGCVRPGHLRPATPKENAENFSGLRSNNTSGYLGAYRAKGEGRWEAKVMHNGKSYRAGTFDSAVEAGEAARLLRLELHTFNDLDRVG